MKIDILICEDKPVLQLGLKELFNSVENCEVIGVACNGREAIEKSIHLHPSLVVLKNDIPIQGGSKVCRRIKAFSQDIPVILLLSKESDIWKVLDSWANGYIVREAPEHSLSAAIDTVCSGGHWIGLNIAKYLISGDGLPILRVAAIQQNKFSSASSLSDREREVLQLVIDGLSNKEIAKELSIKIQTVKVHIRNLFRKLDVDSRAQAISFVLKSGISGSWDYSLSLWRLN